MPKHEWKGYSPFTNLSVSDWVVNEWRRLYDVNSTNPNRNGGYHRKENER